MLLAGLLGSCGPISGAGTNESTGGKTAPEENKHLEIMTYDDDFWQRFVDDFCEKNPGYTVERKLSQAVDTGNFVRRQRPGYSDGKLRAGTCAAVGASWDAGRSDPLL